MELTTYSSFEEYQRQYSYILFKEEYSYDDSSSITEINYTYDEYRDK